MTDRSIGMLICCDFCENDIEIEVSKYNVLNNIARTNVLQALDREEWAILIGKPALFKCQQCIADQEHDDEHLNQLWSRCIE